MKIECDADAPRAGFMRALNPACPCRPRPLLYALFPTTMLFCPPMANPPPSLSWAMLLQITESGAQTSNPFTDHHLPPCAASKPELPPLQTLPIMVGECVLGRPCTKIPLPDPDLLIWLPATRPSLPENVIPTPSQTLLVTHPWLYQPPAFAVTRIAPKLLALLRAPS